MSEQHSPPPTDAHGQVLHDLAVAVGRAHKVEEVIQTAAAEIRLAFGVRIAGLYLRDLSSGILTAGPHEEFSPIYAATIKPNESLIIDESITSKKVSIWPVEAIKHPAIRAGLDGEGFRIVACVPLLSKAEPLGVALIARRSDVPFSPLELHTLRAIGSIIGVAIENAKLYEDLVSHRDQLRALAAAVQQTREVEARRIARDLHDIAGQLLAAIHFKLEELAEALPLQAQEHLEAVRGQLHQAEEHLRRLPRTPLPDPGRPGTQTRSGLSRPGSGNPDRASHHSGWLPRAASLAGDRDGHLPRRPGRAHERGEACEGQPGVDRARATAPANPLHRPR